MNFGDLQKEAGAFRAAKSALPPLAQKSFALSLRALLSRPSSDELFELGVALQNDIVMLAGFETAVAMAHGLSDSVAPPAEVESELSRASFFAAVGLRGSPSGVIARVLPLVTQTAAQKAAFALGVAMSAPTPRPELVLEARRVCKERGAS